MTKLSKNMLLKRILTLELNTGCSMLGFCVEVTSFLFFFIVQDATSTCSFTTLCNRKHKRSTAEAKKKELMQSVTFNQLTLVLRKAMLRKA